jgi:hypothetical protein
VCRKRIQPSKKNDATVLGKRMVWARGNSHCARGEIEARSPVIAFCVKTCPVLQRVPSRIFPSLVAPRGLLDRRAVLPFRSPYLTQFQTLVIS